MVSAAFRKASRALSALLLIAFVHTQSQRVEKNKAKSEITLTSLHPGFPKLPDNLQPGTKLSETSRTLQY